MVYFIEAVGAGLVKIGFTDGDPADRLKQLQTGSAHPLRLRAAVEGDIHSERRLHDEFAHLRAGGEWFKLTMEVEVYIGLAKWVLPRIAAIEAKATADELTICEIFDGMDAALEKLKVRVAGGQG